MKTMMKNSNLMTRVALTLLVMMLTATTAWAWKGSGTENDPYQINNRDDWYTFNSQADTYSGKFFILNADFYIGNNSRYSSFWGTFDGNGHTIEIDQNVYGGNCGLFDKVEGGTIKNLAVTGKIRVFDYITDEGGRGGIVGYLDKGGTVTNCTSKVEFHDGYFSTSYSWISYEVKHIGGVVGAMYAGSKVTNCSFEGYIECRKSCDAIGGIVGYGSDNGNNEISNCLSTGSIKISPFQGDKEPWNEYQGAILGYTKNTTFAVKCVNNYYKENMLEVNRTVVNRISGRLTVGGSSKTDAELKSGKVSRLLNGGNGTTETASGSWGNTVGSNYPSIGGAKVYSVSINGNGNTGGSMSTAYCNASPLPDNKFTKTGYTFLGWSTSATGSTISSVNSDCTLYAKWTVNQYTVKFNSNGGSGSMSNQGFTYGVAQNLTANAFTRTGYTFSGWNTKADGTGTNYNDKQSLSNLTTAADGTVTLYAKWTANQYSVTFNGNGSTGGSMSSQTFTYDQAQNLSANTFTYTGKLFDGWNTASNGSGTSYSDGQSVKNLTATNGATVTLYAQWKLDPNYYPTGSGTADDPYVITSKNHWNTFANANNHEMYYGSDKHIKLGADITVTRMVGGDGHEFCGTFDGDHHTLTVQYGTANAPIEQQQFVAPFVETARNTSPVFRNLTIDGNIYVKYADLSVDPGVGGLIGHLFGNVKVEHCVSNVVINSDKDRVGGFVGLCEYDVTFTDCKSSAVITCTGSGGGFVGWSRASAYTIAFEGCLFDGKLLKKDGVGEGNGGFVGWKGNTKTVNINNCLVALDDVKAMATYHSSTFARNNNYPPNITNSYYTTAFGTAQGTQAHSIKAGEGVSVAMAGDVINEYETSGITFYDTGIMYDGKLYAGKDDVVSLTLSHEDQEGYAFLGYEAKDSHQNAVTLTTAGDNYTLTMPDDDVTVTANVVIGYYSLTLPVRMVVESADREAIGGKYPVGTTIRFKFKSEDYVLEGDVMNGDDVLGADANGIYTVTVGNADITITLKKAVEPNVTLLGEMSYTAKNGDVLTGSTSGTVTIEHGASITLSDVTINGGIVCEGTATIILVGENSVTGLYRKAGIQVGDKGTTLTIKGNGSLTANGGYSGAGIGTGYLNGSIGNITIEGGSITARGGAYGAGIGTGYVDRGTVTLGNITIKGGSITAKGGDKGAGIGTGYVYNGTVNLGTVTIYDDIDLVDATGKGKSGIECNIVYKHGETDVTGSASDYFIINHDNNHDVIESIQNKKFAITLVNNNQHGTVTVAASAKFDDSVAITVTPDNGYMLNTIEVKDANDADVSLSDMSFIMPKSDVTITVTWKLAGVKGDVNGDGKADISDVVALVNIILSDGTDENSSADVNGDGSVDISDVVALVNLILNN